MTTEAAGLGLTDVLAAHRFSFTKSIDGTNDWGWCAGGDSWRTQTRAEHEAHVAEEVRTWLRAALNSPEVVERHARLLYALNEAETGAPTWDELIPAGAVDMREHYLAVAATSLAAAAETLGAK